MEKVSNVVAAAPYSAPLLDRGLRLVKPLPRETDVNLLFKKTPRFNLLLIGGDTVVSKLLETILSSLPDPITVWSPSSQLVLPPLAQTGTLLLREVGALELDDQYRLHEWIERLQDRAWGPQIVSTSEAPLLPRVHAGAFLDVLYYRLNTVYIDISAGVS